MGTSQTAKRGGFIPFESESWLDAMPDTSKVVGQSPVDTSSLASANLPSAAASAAKPSTDWGSVAESGIGAAGAAAGALAQVAGQKYAMDQQAAANNAGRMLSEKLAKMQIGASQEQYEREQNLRALLWALNANKGQQANVAGGREVRRGAFDGMDDLLARVMLKRG